MTDELKKRQSIAVCAGLNWGEICNALRLGRVRCRVCNKPVYVPGLHLEKDWRNATAFCINGHWSSRLGDCVIREPIGEEG